MNDKKYWLTPPEIYSELDKEFHFDFDPCPYPRPEGFNGLTCEWGKMNYVNPPFLARDGGISPFIHKAIQEQQKGKSSVFLISVAHATSLLLRARAQLRYIDRVKWISAVDGTKMPSPPATALFILTGK